VCMVKAVFEKNIVSFRDVSSQEMSFPGLNRPISSSLTFHEVCGIVTYGVLAKSSPRASLKLLTASVDIFS